MCIHHIHTSKHPVYTVCRGVAVVILVYATKLTPTDKEFRAETFGPDTNLMRALNSNGRFNNTGYANVYYVLGLGTDGTTSLDRSRVDTNDPKSVGTPLFIEPSGRFQAAVSSPEGQRHVLSMCEIFSNLTITADSPGESLYAALQNRSSPGSSLSSPLAEGGVACFMRHFRDFSLKLGFGFPVIPATNFVSLLYNFTSMPSNSTCRKDPGAYPQCTAYHDTSVRYGSATRRWDHAHKAWSKAVRWKDAVTQTSTTLTSGAVVAKEVHRREPELRAVLVAMNVSIAWDVSGFKSRPFFDTLEGAADQAIALAERTTTLVGMAGYQMEVDGDGASKWMRMRTEEVMATSSFVGCSISIVVAFVVLTLATGNVVIALYSLVCIAAIIVSCVGYMHVIGWKYGTMEAICVTICVGFSVDFVVHVAIAYSEEATPGETRYQRTERALTEMGVSVVGAAITTGGASVFMIPAPMMPFGKLGVFILWDVFVALLFSVFAFSAMLAVAGPEGSVGELSHIPGFRWLYKKKSEKEKEKAMEADEGGQGADPTGVAAGEEVERERAEWASKKSAIVPSKDANEHSN